jgi:Cell wall-active antibiotics response 4TMS YvqF
MKNKNYNYQNENAPALAGIILLILGGIWLLSEMNIHLPHWLVQPYTFLIGAGIYLGAKKNFRAPFGWLIPLGIGVCWMVANVFHINIWRFGFPVALIAAGAYIIINAINKPKVMDTTNPSFQKKTTDYDDITIVEESTTGTFDPASSASTYQESTTTKNTDHTTNAYTDDTINTTAIFSGVKKMVTSKNFKGGDIVAVLGGTDLNLTFADIQSPAVLDVMVMMGGVQIIIPQGWEVKNNITSILGGVEVRVPHPIATTDKKVLVLKGTVIMGGVDIRNF